MICITSREYFCCKYNFEIIWHAQICEFTVIICVFVPVGLLLSLLRKPLCNTYVFFHQFLSKYYFLLTKLGWISSVIYVLCILQIICWYLSTILKSNRGLDIFIRKCCCWNYALCFQFSVSASNQPEMCSIAFSRCAKDLFNEIIVSTNLNRVSYRFLCDLFS